MVDTIGELISFLFILVKKEPTPYDLDLEF